MPKPTQDMKTLGLFFILTLAFQISFGQRTIYGKVTSIDGEPIKGVNVILVGFKKRVKTNENGEYTITISNNGKRLLFKMKTYKSTEVEIGTRTELNVILTPPVNFRHRI